MPELEVDGDKAEEFDVHIIMLDVQDEHLVVVTDEVEVDEFIAQVTVLVDVQQ